MSLHHAHLHVAPDDQLAEAIDRVVAELEDDIRHGRVADDVSRLLGRRLEAAGVSLPPNAVDDLADAIEADVSL